MNPPNIRKYKSQDRDSVRRIAFDTALLGNSGSAFFEDREVLEDFLTSYYLDYEPESCWVAETESRVIGYLMGAKDESVVNKVFSEKLLLKLLWKVLKRGVIFKKKCFAFIFNSLKSMFQGEFKAPIFNQEYPAVLHINIDEAFRGQGIGSKLIAIYLDYLRSQNVKGVHFPTLSDRAANFYEKLGFKLLYKAKRSYLNNVLHKDIDCYVYGMKLDPNKNS